MATTDIDLGVVAQGPKGDKGDTGATGATGMSGKSYKPYISKSDGHWHLTVDDPNDVLTDPFAVTTVTSSTCDGLTTSGYYGVNSTNVNGKPNSETGLLKVINAGGIITQTMHTVSDSLYYATSTMTPGRHGVRQLNEANERG